MLSSNNKELLLQKICYTDLVYARINKKLGLDFSRSQIETLVADLLKMTPAANFVQNGKNIYVSSFENKIRLTINSYTCRIITADRI